MLPEPLLNILAILLPVALTSCIFYLLRNQNILNTKLLSLQDEKNNLQKNSNEQMKKILQDAQAEAVKIINSANEEARQILTEAHASKDQQDEITQKNLDLLTQKQLASFQKATDDLTRTFQESISKLQTEDINMVKNVTQDIENVISKDMTDFKQVLEQQTISSQKIVGQKIEDQYQLVNKEVEIYKQQELQKVNQSIIELIKQTTQVVIHKSLSLEDHYDLVEQALNDTKTQLHLTQNHSTPTQPINSNIEAQNSKQI